MKGYGFLQVVPGNRHYFDTHGVDDFSEHATTFSPVVSFFLIHQSNTVIYKSTRKQGRYIFLTHPNLHLNLWLLLYILWYSVRAEVLFCRAVWKGLRSPPICLYPEI